MERNPDILERGWNAKVGAFTQHYGTEVLDSSLLLMPMQGFIAPQDPISLDSQLDHGAGPVARATGR